MKTIAIDFDGVIHKYSGGWKDGSIYDEPVEGAFQSIRALMDKGYSVFVFSTRSPHQINRWINGYLLTHDMYYDSIFSNYGYIAEVIPFWKKFWNKPNVLGITKRKLPAQAYIDDRAVLFTNWKDILTKFN